MTMAKQVLSLHSKSLLGSDGDPKRSYIIAKNNIWNVMEHQLMNIRRKKEEEL